MGEYKEKDNRQSRTIDNLTAKSTQPSISEILQFRKERYWDNSTPKQDTALIQQSKNAPIQYKSDGVIQRSIYIGETSETLTPKDVQRKYFPETGTNILDILKAYDSQNYLFQTVQELLDTTNGQLVFTPQFWQSEIDKKDYPKTQLPKYWENYRTESRTKTVATSASSATPAKKKQASKKPIEPRRTLADIINTIAPALLGTLDTLATLPTPPPKQKLYKSLARTDAEAIVAWVGSGKVTAEAMARAQAKTDGTTAFMASKSGASSSSSPSVASPPGKMPSIDPDAKEEDFAPVAPSPPVDKETEKPMREEEEVD